VFIFVYFSGSFLGVAENRICFTDPVPGDWFYKGGFANQNSTNRRRTLLNFPTQLNCNSNEAKELDKNTWFLGIHVLPHQGIVVVKHPRLDRPLRGVVRHET
jgi:hypothetical protein